MAVTQSGFSPDIETPGSSEPYYDTPTERSSHRPRQLKSKKDASSGNLKAEASPSADEFRKENLTLPASTYKENRRSSLSLRSDADTINGDDGLSVPLAYDPTPASGPSPLVRNRVYNETTAEDGSSKLTDGKPHRDYFSGRKLSKSSRRESLREEDPGSSRSSGTEAEKDAQQLLANPPLSPHIAYQEKGRAPSTTVKRKEVPGSSGSKPTSAATSPATGSGLDRPRAPHSNSQSYTLSTSMNNETFKLQEAPRTRRSGSGRGLENYSPSLTPVGSVNQEGFSRQLGVASADPEICATPLQVETPQSTVNPFDDPQRNEQYTTGPKPAITAASLLQQHVERPKRGDSLAASSLRSTNSTREPAARSILDLLTPNPGAQRSHDRNASTSSIPTVLGASNNDSQYNVGRNSPSSTQSQTVRSLLDPPVPPTRASSRPQAMGFKASTIDMFVTPRVPPPPPSANRHRNNESISTIQSDFSYDADQPSPRFQSIRYEGQPGSPARHGGLPKHIVGAEFSMEEEMARILKGEDRGDENPDVPQSVLRRVSNAVKHGRSFSDKGLRSMSNTPKWRSPNASMDISSPTKAIVPRKVSPDSTEEMAQLRNQLRRAQHRIAELETDKMGLEGKINGSVDIKQVNTELREKRSTMAFLDTQKEMVVRELEIMTEHLTKVKDSNKALDFPMLKSEILQDFANSLAKLKDNMESQIEDLVHKKNELTEEISNLIQMKDQGFQEYESLSTKNSQLSELNSQLVQNIQEMYKSHREPNGSMDSGSREGAIRPSVNGLGTYTTHQRDRAEMLMELRNASSHEPTSSLLQDQDVEPAQVLNAPQVVNIRKGQPKKFNWKRGGHAVAKNVTKGLKGAFASGDRMPMNVRDGQYNVDGIPYGSTVQGSVPSTSETSSVASTIQRQAADPRAQGFGFFNQKGGNALRPGQVGRLQNHSNSNLAAEAATVLFGSDLSARCEFEQREVPSIVSRCIEEVELRGMDIEGVYRKSGGSGQVKSVQLGFEKDGNYEVSDPDLDIHAITSALKQYFRKLPMPLITYDVYELLLEATQIQDVEKQALSMRVAVNELPKHHRNCLDFLVGHLARVMAHESDNLMTPLNLAVVFAPTIMRPESIEREMTDMLPQRMAVQSLLENNKVIFPADD
ncbi:Rho-type gtpase-activating protein [Cryomyces antarcticus]|nr:Rho-type gtpase-activating protein [Cryomyces antarcticus]